MKCCIKTKIVGQILIM